MDKHKLLFFIHVPWKWIKQRPHFIAEGLAEKYEVIVCQSTPFDKAYRGGESNVLKIMNYFQLPKDRIPFIHQINKILFRISLKKQINETDVIWITNPFQYTLIKNIRRKAKVVYDCMDDLPEFEPTLQRREKLERLEGILYKEADVVIASSNYLKGKLIQRYGERDVNVVNNAIKEMGDYKAKELPTDIKVKMPNDKYVISYIGTIEKWLDFSLLTSVLDVNPNVAFCFFGPLKTALPQHDRIHYCGMVPHDMVFSVMEQSDALIMPFVINELILSVNPVKLYEYIYSGKPCLAPRYGESESFGEYVYLYQSVYDCHEIINSLVKGKGAKHSQEECRAFALANTWKERIEQIEKLL